MTVNFDHVRPLAILDRIIGDICIGRVRGDLLNAVPAWRRRDADSYLPEGQKTCYRALLAARLDVLDWLGR